MIVRSKGGEYRVADVSVLCDFLGVKKEAAGPLTITGDLELIASVPFCLAAVEGGNSNAVAAIPDGIVWTFSTFDLDRFGERIDPAGWDYKRYLENPVIEWAHRYDIPAIGKAEHIYADEKGLHGSIVFNSKEYDPFGWGIGERVKARVIRAGSVGFRILEIEIPSQEDGRDGTSLIFRKQELLEFSICNVPANPFALSKSEELGMRSKETTQALCSSGFWGNLIHNL